MTIREYAKQYKILHAKLEKRVAPIFYKALAQTVAPVLLSLNPDSIIESPWLDAYKKAYRLYAVAAQQEYQWLKQQNPTKDLIDFLNEQWRLIMERYGSNIAFDFATDLNETTLNQIRKAIADGNASYATNSQIARIIRQYTLGDIGRTRSLLIARTETTTGTNIAKLEGAKTYFNEIGEPEGYKMWISRADSHVRHDHMVINETAVPFTSKFDVGVFEADAPGDATLPAKERVRCRCTFVTLSKAGYQRRFNR